MSIEAETAVSKFVVGGYSTLVPQTNPDYYYDSFVETHPFDTKEIGTNVVVTNNIGNAINAMFVGSGIFIINDEKNVDSESIEINLPVKCAFPIIDDKMELPLLYINPKDSITSPRLIRDFVFCRHFLQYGSLTYYNKCIDNAGDINGYDVTIVTNGLMCNPGMSSISYSDTLSFDRLRQFIDMHTYIDADVSSIDFVLDMVTESVWGCICDDLFCATTTLDKTEFAWYALYNDKSKFIRLRIPQLNAIIECPESTRGWGWLLTNPATSDLLKGRWEDVYSSWYDAAKALCCVISNKWPRLEKYEIDFIFGKTKLAYPNWNDDAESIINESYHRNYTTFVIPGTKNVKIYMW